MKSDEKRHSGASKIIPELINIEQPRARDSVKVVK
jgi:hypothetical protein